MGLRAFIEKIFGKTAEEETAGGRRNGNGNGHGKSRTKEEGDLTLSCVECKKDFIFELGEQKFYKMRGLTPPKRCTNCRGRRRRR